MNGKFQIFNGSNKQYYFRLKASNGETIGHSEGYIAKQSAENGIASVRANSQSDSRYTIFQGSDKQYYFNLKAANGEIILSSEGYVTKQGAENGKEAVKKYAPTADVEDLTSAAT
ncbi:MAG: YegP family protein [Pseudohongiella sp.]|uniref:YegP family protein n=1 Tax=Pseudohongiella sp. TaxID=1979412 RepID=UPI0034A091A5